MRRLIIQRLAMAIVTLFGVTVVVFVLSRAQGDPRAVLLDESTTQKEYERWGKDMGLDRPLLVQYFVYAGKLARFDLGESILQKRPVSAVLMERLPASLELGAAATLLSILLGGPLGVLAAVNRGRAWDYSARVFALLGQALPPFWIAIVLVLLFAVTLEWLPTSRRGDWQHLVLPAVTLGWFSASGQLRLFRSSLIEQLDAEYLKLARAKGVSRVAVIWKHAVRNAMIAPLTFAGLTFAELITGSIVVESVFAWPGLGLLAIQAVHQTDYPVLQGVILLVTVGFVTANLLVDILYAYLDPRIKYP